MTTLATAFVRVMPDYTGFGAVLIKGIEKEAEVAGLAAGKMFGTSFSKGTVLASVAVTTGVATIFAASVKSAGDFEASMVKLTTTAGETGTMVRGNLKTVADGILSLAGSTGTSVKQLSDGMYTVESAGFHGADGLNVLKASAQAARAEQANLTTVTNAVTSAMISYHLPADQATKITDQMITATSRGKLTFEQLSGSLATVLPLASSVGLSFSEVTGAEATMTSHGESADLATQHLAYTIRGIVAPNAVAVKEMQRMGLSSVDLAQHLGERGLTGTLKIMTDAVLQHMGPAGNVLTTSMQQSANATRAAQKEMESMPPGLRKLAEEYLNGTISAGEWRTEIRKLPADQANLARQFAVTANNAHGFNDLLKAGGPEARTYNEIIKRMTGGVNGLQTTLMLTGENMPLWTDNVKAIGEASKHTGENVHGWGEIQETFNFKMSSLKGHLEGAKIALGEGLLPVMKKMLDVLGAIIVPITDFVTKHKDLSAAILAAAGSFGALIIALYLLEKAIAIVKGATILWTAVTWLAHAAMYAWELITIRGAAALLLYEIRMNAVAVATKVWTGLQWLLNVALDANPIGLVVIAIAALVAGIIYAWFHFSAFRDVLIKIGASFIEFLGTIKKAAIAVADWAVDVGKSFMKSVNDVKDWAVKVYNSFLDFIGTLGKAAVAVKDWAVGVYKSFTDFLGTVVHVLTEIGNAIGNILAPAVNVMKVIFETAWSVIKLAFQVGWAVINIIFALWKIEIQAIINIWQAFAAVWSKVWDGIKEVAGRVWNAVKAFFVEIYDWVAVRLTRMWNEFANTWSANWDKIKEIAGKVWNTVKGWFTEIYDWVDNKLTKLINAFRDTWNKVWGAIKDNLGLMWLGMKVIFGEIMSWVDDKLSPKMRFLQSVIEFVWDKIKDKISTVWNTVKGIFEAIGNFISNTLPDFFRRGADNIGRLWDTLMEKTKRPVKFVIDTVINGGIIHGINWVSDKLGISGTHIDDFHPPGFQSGGIIPGTPSAKDNTLIHAATGEYVMPTDKTARFLPVLEAMRSGSIAGFEDGGLIGDIVSGVKGITRSLTAAAGDVLGALSDPVKLLSGPLNALIDRIPGSGGLHDVLTGAGHKFVGWMGDWINQQLAALAALSGGGGIDTGQAPAAMAFLKAQVGKPYVWGGIGPGGYDCSGLVNAVYNVMQGKPPHHRTFYTMNQAGFFPLPGTDGVLAAGWSNTGESGPGGGPGGVGHTTAVLSGVPFGSEGGVGVRMGAAVTNINRFAHRGHVGAALIGGVGKAAGGSLGAWIARAIQLTGVPASWAGPLNTLIMRESGGNPNAINRTDANARAGHPSQGLMQVIPSTFSAYHLGGTSNSITDPVANVAAGIRYILARYGSISNVQQANASMPPKGYEAGGLINGMSMDSGRGVLSRGFNLIHNGTGKDEPITATDKLEPLFERLICAVEKIAPGVGNEIRGTGRGLLQAARAY